MVRRAGMLRDRNSIATINIIEESLILINPWSIIVYLYVFYTSVTGIHTTSATTDFPSGAPLWPGAIIAFLVALATPHYCLHPRRHFRHSCSWRILHSNSLLQRNLFIPLSSKATSLQLSPTTQPLYTSLLQHNLSTTISPNAPFIHLSSPT